MFSPDEMIDIQFVAPLIVFDASAVDPYPLWCISSLWNCFLSENLNSIFPLEEMAFQWKWTNWFWWKDGAEDQNEQLNGNICWHHLISIIFAGYTFKLQTSELDLLLWPRQGHDEHIVAYPSQLFDADLIPAQRNDVQWCCGPIC